MADDAATSTETKVVPPIPAISDLLIQTSLYDLMPVSDKDQRRLATLKEENFQIDAFCIHCKDRSIFKTHRTVTRKPPISISNSPSTFRESSVFDTAYFSCMISCVRCSYSYRYYFLLTKDGLTKVGQYPSLEDIGSNDLTKYRKFLHGSDYGELKRASGLFSHGIGIGAFVYLRRIFERLICSHREQYEEGAEPIPNFEGLSMDEKIKSLSSVLPRALVEHRKVYGILSAGIHALDEKTCRKYFPVIKAAILQILDQDIAAKEALAAEVALKQEIAAILGEVQGKT
jgi:hypothetical protein